MGDDQSSTDNKNNQRRSGNCNCTRICFVLSVITCIVGIILVTSGIQEQKLANQMNPNEDFTVIEPECDIVGTFLLGSKTRYCKEKNNEKPCGCDDVYSYLIYAPQLARLDDYYVTHQGDNYNYESRQHEIARLDVQSCNEGRPASPKWEGGETTACWHPSNPEKAVHENYKCGNDECIKVLSPYDETDDAIEHAQALWAGGLISLCLSVITGFIAFWLKKGVSAEGSHGGNPMNTATATPQQHIPTAEVVSPQYNSSNDKNSSGSGAILFKK